MLKIAYNINRGVKMDKKFNETIFSQIIKCREIIVYDEPGIVFEMRLESAIKKEIDLLIKAHEHVFKSTLSIASISINELPAGI
jgi:hypothetical protein